MQFLILFIVAAVVSSIGFKKFIYFISIGYGFSIAAIGVALLILFHGNFDVVTLLFCIMLIFYGCRLGGYLLIRELKSTSYKTTLKDDINSGSDTKFPVKVIIWLSCALLYACEAAPILFRLQNNISLDPCAIAGLAVMVSGILLEAVSDWQKNQFKKSNPKRFCDVGLFKIVRCPNYLGELLCWTGVFISGFTACKGVFQWSAAIFGWVAIVYIMFSGARRLELRQNKHYGDDPEYQNYVKKAPILIPLVPLYSVAKYKWLVG